MKTIMLLISLMFAWSFAMANESPSDTAKLGLREKTKQKVQYGTASYYHPKFAGRKTSSGEPYNPEKMTAAHNGLPMNTWIRVTNLRNNRSVVVRVNDRMHHRNKRLVDLSRSAAKKLGYVSRGLTRVKVEILGKNYPFLLCTRYFCRYQNNTHEEVSEGCFVCCVVYSGKRIRPGKRLRSKSHTRYIFHIN
jgi:rare lipoprotein A